MRYHVRYQSEEFSCPDCGDPVTVGDIAWQEPNGGPVYCSEHCANARFREDWEPDNDRETTGSD